MPTVSRCSLVLVVLTAGCSLWSAPSVPNFDGLEPGESRLSDVISRFGYPDQVEITTPETLDDEWDLFDISEGGERHVSYEGLGLEIRIAADDADDADPKITSIWYLDAFPGRTAGLAR